MGKIGISWYKPYKSPEDFFAQKVHNYNDIVRLTNADPNRINSLSGAIESFIDNEAFNYISTNFINAMIHHNDPRYDKVLESYISHTIDKISSGGVCEYSGHWSILTQMDKIKSYYNSGKVTESANQVYCNCLYDMAKAQISANTCLDTDEAIRVLERFGSSSDITMESILNWQSSNLRKELSSSDPVTANICDMICNNSSSYFELAAEAFEEDERDKINLIISTVDNVAVTSTVIDSIRLIFAEHECSEDIINCLINYYNENQFNFSPEVFCIIICKLYQANLLALPKEGICVENIPDEVIHRIRECGLTTIEERPASESFDLSAANAIPDDNSQGMLNNYNLARITPGMTYNEAINEYVWVNRAYNDVMTRLHKLDTLHSNDPSCRYKNIRSQLEDKRDYLNDVLNAINSCARTTFRFSDIPGIQNEPKSSELHQFIESSKPMDIPVTPAVTALLESLQYSTIEYTMALEAVDEDDENEPVKFRPCPAELTMNMNLSKENKDALRERIKKGLIQAGLSEERAVELIDKAQSAANHIRLKDLTQDNDTDWKKFGMRYLEYAKITTDTSRKNLTGENADEDETDENKTTAEKTDKRESKLDAARQKIIDAKNKVEEFRNDKKRKKSESRFHSETSSMALQYKRYKKHAQEVDLKITNMLKDLTRVVFVGKSTKETRREIIEGKHYSITTILKQLLAGYMVFASSKIAFILLLIVRMCNSGKVKRSEKKKILMELEGELQMIEEKIRDATIDGNREAKYALMRDKINLENAIKRIKMNSEMDKYSAGSARDVAVNEIRV